jgi:hypothetical protein
MRIGTALVLMTIIAIQPVGVLGASYRSEPNPVGEKVYASQLPRLLVPIAIVIGGFSLAGLVAVIRRRTGKVTADDPQDVGVETSARERHQH